MTLFMVATAPPPGSARTLPKWPSPVSRVTLPVARVDAEHRLLQRVLGGDEQALAVAGPGDRADRAVPILGQRAHLAGGEVAELQHLAVGFVAGARHREIGQRPAVGRDGRQIVRAVVGVGQVGRRRAAVRGRGENVEIGRAVASIRPGLAQREIDGLAVGRECDLLAAADRLGRRIADQLCRSADAAAGQLSAVDRESRIAATATPGSAQVSQWRTNNWS